MEGLSEKTDSERWIEKKAEWYKAENKRKVETL
jgi:hypothetical protein